MRGLPQQPNLRVIACEAVAEELRSLLPAQVDCQVFDFGLRVNPNGLTHALQEAIDDIPASIKAVSLGYGLCSQAVAGLRSNQATLIVPRVDDCIGIFLGSHEAYRRQAATSPGTYYLTKGWIEAANGLFAEYDQLVARYGEDRAAWLMDKMLAGYTRLALINTGQYNLDRYRSYARKTAERFNLCYEEIMGSTALLRKLVRGPWDEDFVVVPPGRAITVSHFRETAAASSAGPETDPIRPGKE